MKTLRELIRQEVRAQISRRKEATSQNDVEKIIMHLEAAHDAVAVAEGFTTSPLSGPPGIKPAGIASGEFAELERAIISALNIADKLKVYVGGRDLAGDEKNMGNNISARWDDISEY